MSSTHPKQVWVVEVDHYPEVDSRHPDYTVVQRTEKFECLSLDAACVKYHEEDGEFKEAFIRVMDVGTGETRSLNREERAQKREIIKQLKEQA